MADEHKTIIDGIEYARSNYEKLPQELNISLIYKTESGVEIKKPIPVIPSDDRQDYEKRFLGIKPFSRIHSKTVADDIVGYRFGDRASVRKILTADFIKTIRVKHPPLSQRLLATCFLEMCFYKDMKILAEILDALYNSDYHKFKLYYLIQWSHRIENELCLNKWDDKEVKKLCQIVNPNETTGPFSKLI